MSLQIIEQQIKKYLENKDSSVLALKGGWGVGKTYSWNKYLEEHKNKLCKDKYSYVSLFGINSLKELKQVIFENLLKKDLIGTHPTIESFKQNRISFAESWGRKASSFARNLPVLQDFSSSFDSVAFMSINNIMICIDDIERRGPNLTIKEILGLVSLLKEQKSCKVALLLNDGEDGLDDYDKYREKVIDIELEFDPSCHECSKIAFGTDQKYSAINRHSTFLDIKNIRILNKIKNIFDQVYELSKSYENELLNQISHSLTLYSWSLFSKGEDIPPIDFICNSNFLSVSLKDKTEPSEEEKMWKTTISSYGYTTTDDLDRYLRQCIHQGYIVEEQFRELAEEKNLVFIAQKNEKAFSEAWGKYHRSFKDDEDEVLTEIYESFKKSAKYISRVNLNSTVQLLKDFDRISEATEIIELYVDVHKENHKVFDLSENNFFNDITDEEIIERFNIALKESTTFSSPKDTIIKLSKQNGWSSEDEECLSNTTSEEFYTILKDLEVDNFSSCINVGLKFGRFSKPSPRQLKIYNNFKEALIKIGRESKINKRRLRRYDIIIEDDV